MWNMQFLVWNLKNAEKLFYFEIHRVLLIPKQPVIKQKLFVSVQNHQHDDVIMETFSALLAICAENSPVIGEFPAQRPVTRSFDVSFDQRLNKRLNKQNEMMYTSIYWRPNEICQSVLSMMF